LGLHAKPVGLLNVQGFFAGFLAQTAHAEAQGLLRPQHRAMQLVAETPEALLAAMRAYRPAPVEKWIERRDT
jgi:hypothetical protein